jgi:hypothetical protein
MPETNPHNEKLVLRFSASLWNEVLARTKAAGSKKRKFVSDIDVSVFSSKNGKHTNAGDSRHDSKIDLLKTGLPPEALSNEHAAKLLLASSKKWAPGKCSTFIGAEMRSICVPPGETTSQMTSIAHLAAEDDDGLDDDLGGGADVTCVGGMKYQDLLKHMTSLRTEHVVRLMRPLVTKLMLHPRNAGLFNHPVDHDGLGLSDYLERVAHPMDFGTFKSRLMSGQYYTIESAVVHIELVMKNAMSYNPKGHPVYTQAADLMNDFKPELRNVYERLVKETERKAAHSCNLCNGLSCSLCGEKCLKLEPPVVCCYGPCGQRIKRHLWYFVTRDGSRHWCQKCYSGLGTVLIPASGSKPCLTKKDVLKRKTEEESAEPWVKCDRCSQWMHQVCSLYNHLAGKALSDEQIYFECPLCKLDDAAQERKIEKGRLAQAAALVKGEEANSSKHVYGTRGGGRNPHITKKLLASNKAAGADADVDADADGTDSVADSDSMAVSDPGFASTRVDGGILSCNGDTHQDGSMNVSPGAGNSSSSSSSSSSSNSSSRNNNSANTGAGENEGDAECEVSSIVTAMDDSEALELQARTYTSNEEAGTDVHRRLTVDGNGSGHGSTNNEDEADMADMAASASDCDTETETPRAADGAGSDAGRLLSLHPDERGEEGVVERAVGAESSDSSCTLSGERAESKTAITSTTTLREQGQPECKSEAEAEANSNAAATGAPETEREGEAEGPTAAAVTEASCSVAVLPSSYRQWRASRLPRSRLSDFIEACVRQRLCRKGFAAAVVDSITVRMPSNSRQWMEVPEAIRENLVAPNGNKVSRYLGYSQKCILLFQTIDAVDVCLFSLYVQEFDKSCPEPNRGRVYVSYLDSVEYFRPLEARTLVYHEIMVAYLKWAQMRGFSYGHIWACPPQRGDNFIFWNHPSMQRTPSRDRLTAWYTAMLRRAESMGAITKSDSLYTHFFRQYARRERDEGTLRGAARNSFVGVGLLKPNPGSPRSAALLPEPPTNSFGPSNDTVNGTTNGTLVAGAIAGTLVAATETPVPICPPVFDGEFWVNEAVRAARLVQGRAKGGDGQDRLTNQRKCRDLLKSLSSRNIAVAFNQPVDPVALGLPNYHQVVRRPMDLRTVKDNLRANKLQNILTFASDVRLAFSNAMLFNPPQHAVHKHAAQLLGEFNAALLELATERVGVTAEADNLDAHLASWPLTDPPSTAATASGNANETGTGTPAASSVSAVGGRERSHSKQFQAVPAVRGKGSHAISLLASHTGSVHVPLGGASPRALANRDSRDSSGGAVPTLRFHPNLERAEQGPVPEQGREQASGASVPEGSDCGANNGIENDASTHASSRASDVGDGVDLDEDENDAVTLGDESLGATSHSTHNTSLLHRTLSGDSMAMGAGNGTDFNMARRAHFSDTLLGSGRTGVECRVDDSEPFEKPQLGFRGAQALMHELSKNVSRLKEDLFLIHFAPRSDSNAGLGSDADGGEEDNDDEINEESSTGSQQQQQQAQLLRLKSRGKGRPPAYLRLPLDEADRAPFPEEILDMTADLAGDTSDPDPEVSNSMVDSRHTFLEMAQLRKYQYDSLRRAKHSSLMLLYHLNNPKSASTRLSCDSCNRQLVDVRWHCERCTEPFDLCNDCGTSHLHEHELTPVRVTYGSS